MNRLEQELKIRKLKIVKKVSCFVLAGSIVGTLVCGPGLISKIQDYSQNDNLNDQIRTEVVASDNMEEYEGLDNSIDVINNNPTLKNIDFNELNRINEDTVGWLQLDDSNIDYPVVQGNDNDYYLHNSIEGESNACGTLFVDSNNNPNIEDNITVIYGHNMLNDSMFGGLDNFTNQEYYNTHSSMYYYTKDGVYKLNIFAGETMPTDKINILNYSNPNDFENQMQEVKNNSDFSSNFDVTKGDNVVALVTCTPNSETGKRYVLYTTAEKILEKNYQAPITL